MPTRIIRDGILTSERINMLSERAELFYRRLMSVVDDYGRFPSNLMLLRASCYPLKLDSVKEDAIKKHLSEAKDAGLIDLYTVGNKTYLEIKDFGQRINGKPKFPGIAESSPGIPGKIRLDVDVDVVEDVGVMPRTTKRRKTEKCHLPEDFGISEAVKAWAAEKGHARLTDHLESFRAKSKAKAYTYADWDSAFMEAVRADWAKLGASNDGASRGGASSVAAGRKL